MGLRRRLTRLFGVAGAAFAGLYAYSWFAIRRFENLDPATAGAPGSFLTINGLRIHYVEAGQGPPVVLIHGWNGSTFDLRYIIPELARHHRVVALDLIGFGYSARPARGDYSVSAQVELVRGLMERLDIDRADVLGHSMGGAIAMSFALRYPDRVARLVLVDSASLAEMRLGVRLGRLIAPLLPIVGWALLQPRMRLWGARAAVHDPAVLTPDVLEARFRPFHMKGHLRGLAQQTAQRGLEEAIDPSRIRAPVLILWGEHDRVIPLSRGKELAAHIPGARLEVIWSAGHMPLEEQPAVCNRLLGAFLLPGPKAGPPSKGVAAGLETAG